MASLKLRFVSFFVYGLKLYAYLYVDVSLGHRFDEF